MHSFERDSEANAPALVPIDVGFRIGQEIKLFAEGNARSATLSRQLAIIAALSQFHAREQVSAQSIFKLEDVHGNIPVQEFGFHCPEQVYNQTGDMKKEAMKVKSQNRARGVLGPRQSRYM